MKIKIKRHNKLDLRKRIKVKKENIQ